MQKKKYLFSLVVLAISLVGVFGGRIRVMAEENIICTCALNTLGTYKHIGDFPTNDMCLQECSKLGGIKYCYGAPCTPIDIVVEYNCVCANGSKIPFYYPSVGQGSQAAGDDECNQDCADKGAEYYSYSNLATVGFSRVTKAPKIPVVKTVGCYNAVSGKCSNLDKAGGAKCDSPALWCTGDVECKDSSTCPVDPINPGTNPGTTPDSSTSTEFINPLQSNTIDGVLTSLLTALSGLVVTLAIIFIVLGGILYMVSAGDPGMIKRAKDCWLFSVIGLAIVVAAPTFLKEVQTILGGSVPDSTGKIASALTVGAIATNVLNFLLSIVGIIAIISLVIAGGMYMTAYGDDTRIGTAKKMGTYAIVGIVVALVSLIAVQQVSKLITG
jgi:hypothetical protein